MACGCNKNNNSKKAYRDKNLKLKTASNNKPTTSKEKLKIELLKRFRNQSK